MVLLKSYLLLIEVRENEAPPRLQLGLRVGFVIRTRLHVICKRSNKGIRLLHSYIWMWLNQRSQLVTFQLVRLTVLILGGEPVGQPVGLG